MRKQIISFIVVAACLFTFSGLVSANGDINREELYVEKVKEANQVQESLVEGKHTASEVKKQMSPYFSNNFIELFIKESMREENGEFYVAGTDFPMHFIPYFEYGDQMKIVPNSKGNKVIVYEHFEGTNEGPVGYDDHYEAVKFIQEKNEWKIDQIDVSFSPHSMNSTTVLPSNSVENEEQAYSYTGRGDTGLQLLISFKGLLSFII